MGVEESKRQHSGVPGTEPYKDSWGASELGLGGRSLLKLDPEVGAVCTEWGRRSYQMPNKTRAEQSNSRE